MTDGNTYEINRRLNDQEDWDALQEVTAELEQAEARIEELEAQVEGANSIIATEQAEVLALRKKMAKAVAELEQAEARIVELEAKLAKAVSFTSDVAYRATTIEHDRDEMWLLDLDVLRHERDCDITQARTTLAELKREK